MFINHWHTDLVYQVADIFKAHRRGSEGEGQHFVW